MVSTFCPHQSPTLLVPHPNFSSCRHSLDFGPKILMTFLSLLAKFQKRAYPNPMILPHSGFASPLFVSLALVYFCEELLGFCPLHRRTLRFLSLVFPVSLLSFRRLDPSSPLELLLKSPLFKLFRPPSFFSPSQLPILNTAS